MLFLCYGINLVPLFNNFVFLIKQNYPASNLLNNSIKKWKSEESGLGTVYVVLQLENPTKITGIDIGNENSVFIEVSVGRTGWPVDKFKVRFSIYLQFK